MTKSRGILSPRRFWTDAEVQQLILLYPDHRGEDVARALGRNVRAVYFKANDLGLKKSAAFLASDKSARIRRGRQHLSMIATRIQPGNVPWNKGMKGLQFEGCKATQFKSGQRPRNSMPIGSYRVVPGGSGQGAGLVLERKVSELAGASHLRWKPVHRLVWVDAHGPVPAGHIVVFKPGMRTTVLTEITVDRLECISRAENARRNHPRSKSPELGKLVQLKGAITRQVNRIVREHTTGEHS